MEAGGDLWQGLVRWRQNQQALRLGLKGAASPKTPVTSSPKRSSSDKLQNDLLRADQKSAHHLAVPAKKERLIMGKIKLLGLVLLFLLAGALFFIAGFLTCYTVFPPTPTSFSAAPPGEGPYGVSRVSEGLGVAPQSSSHLVTSGGSYAARQSMLNAAPGHQGSVLHRAEQQTLHQAKVQAHNFITRMLNRWGLKLRSMLGYYAGSAIAPMTTGLAQKLVDSTLPLGHPGGTTGTHSGAAQAAQTGHAAQTTQTPKTGSGSGSRASLGSSRSVSSTAAGASQKTNNGSRGHGTASRAAAGSSASSPGRFTILVQSFANSEEAFYLSSDLKAKGFGAYVVQETSGSGLKFSVKVGQFSNFTDARDAASILSHQWHRPARVVMIDPVDGH